MRCVRHWPCRDEPAGTRGLNEICSPRRPRAETPPGLVPAGTPLHIALAPGMLDRKQTIVREPGQSDGHYPSRCGLPAALLDDAREASA